MNVHKLQALVLTIKQQGYSLSLKDLALRYDASIATVFDIFLADLDNLLEACNDVILRGVEVLVDYNISQTILDYLSKDHEPNNSLDTDYCVSFIHINRSTDIMPTYKSTYHVNKDGSATREIPDNMSKTDASTVIETYDKEGNMIKTCSTCDYVPCRIDTIPVKTTAWFLDYYEVSNNILKIYGGIFSADCDETRNLGQLIGYGVTEINLKDKRMGYGSIGFVNITEIQKND